MKKVIIYVFLIFAATYLYADDTKIKSNAKTVVFDDIIMRSRANCVEILVNSKTRSGTGFFIDSIHVVTCFHVIAKEKEIIVDKGKIIDYKYKPYSNIKIRTENGDEINAEVVFGVPLEKDLSPMLYDFAVLKLETKHDINNQIFPRNLDGKVSLVGEKIFFSGYPLNSPTMLTHAGLVSGITNNLICIQASINQGNSGGALLNNKGNIIGIISMREGGLYKSFLEMSDKIKKSSKYGSITSSIGGVSFNARENFAELINLVNKHISTGIGYAWNINFLNEYLKRNPLK